MANKPVVRFAQFVGVEDTGRGISARLNGVAGHPTPGVDGDGVRTSRVMRLEFGTDGYPAFVETKNTIFVRTA